MKPNPDLSDEQKAVLFEGATERPYSGTLLHVAADGTFTCANCYSPLFASDAIYDSGSGWPSFDDALPGSVVLREDNSHGMLRTEVVCASCGGHLGHRFPDGPPETTGQRYCINSLALDFTKRD